MKRVSAMSLLLAFQLAGASPPKLVREIDLKQVIPGRPGYASVAVTFSPDEN